MPRAHSHPAIPHGTLHSFTHAIDVPSCLALHFRKWIELLRTIFECARQKCAALRGNKGDRGTYIRDEKGTRRSDRGKETRRNEKERERERKRDERTVLSPANAFPSTSSLLREEHEKSNVSIFRSSPVPLASSHPALTLQSFRSCYVLFSFSASRAIFPTKRTVRRSSYRRDKFLQLEPANDGHRQVPVIWKG